MYISSWRSPFKNVFFMSICWIFHLYVRAKDMMSLIEVILTTGEKVSWKSNPCYWWNPFSISLALYLLMLPSKFSLTMKIHLYTIEFLYGGREVRIQVPSFKRELYSVCFALNHSGWDKAYLVVVGYEWTKNDFGLDLPVLALVSIRWLLTRRNVCGGWLWNDGDKDPIDW